MSELKTPLDEIPVIREAMRKGFQTGKTKSIAYRKQQLLALAYMIKDNEKSFGDALASDLGRPDLENSFYELGSVVAEILEAYKKVGKWAKTQKAEFALNYFLMRPAIRKEPKGTVLIIAPFNFPVLLLLGPCAGAIAAGNTVVLKPSELASATCQLIADLVPKYLDPDVVTVVTGGVEETTKLLELHWDHILYTGSDRVGKIVAAAAAKHLTPVTLELGGKCPVVIDPKSDLNLAARRILVGKFTNAGQICTAPDYVLCPKEVEDKFVEELKTVYSQFYPTDPKTSEMSRIISTGHVERLKGLVEKTNGKIVIGGETDVSERYVAPTIVRDVTGDDSLMSEEIFGPVLPIIPVSNVNEAISFINERDHPLALYVFSQDSQFKSKVFDNTQSGSAMANELVLHYAVTGLPFGGIGPSGSGATTGKYGFDTFTHLRSTLDSPGWLDKVMHGRFPPYSPKKIQSLAALGPGKLPPRPASLAVKATEKAA